MHHKLSEKKDLRNCSRIVVLISNEALVGITEDLPTTVKALEIIVPDFFEGASEIFRTLEGSFHEKSKTANKMGVSSPLKLRLTNSFIVLLIIVYYRKIKLSPICSRTSKTRIRS